MSDLKRVEPGSIVINSANIINHNGVRIDVLKLIVSLHIYEDIMMPFVTGKMVVNDAVSLAEELPFIGEEMLVLDMETPSPNATGPTATHQKIYHIYKIESKENLRQKSVVYTICFQSLDSYVDANKRVSKTYRGSVKANVRKVLEGTPGLNTGKKVYIEDTRNTATFTANFWSPSQVVYYLAAQAINSNGNPGFVFFENYDGFNFTSIENLYGIGQERYLKLERNQSVRDPEETQSIDAEYGKVLDMSTPKLLDFMERLQSGYYGGSIYHFDVDTKRLNYRTLVAKDDVMRVKLNPNLMTGENTVAHPNANKLLKVISKNLYGSTQAQLPLHHEMKAMSVMSQATALTINIQIFGRLNYTVGTCVDLLVYSDKAITSDTPDEQTVDKVLSGKYLITALSHEITRESHLCNLELCKDSFNKTL